MTRSTVTIFLLRRSGEDATSTNEGVSCLLRVITMTLPWSVPEYVDEWKELEVQHACELPLVPSLR